MSKWYKEFDEINGVWVVGKILNEVNCPMFIFANEDVADLMLFCLERVIE